MAEVGIRAQLSGAAEAQAGLQGLDDQMKKLLATQSLYATTIELINGLSEMHAEAIKGQSSETSKLSDETRKLTEETRRSEQAERVAERTVEHHTSAIRSQLTAFGARLVSIAAIVGALSKMSSAGREAELAEVRLDAVLKATGATAGFTAQQLNQMAEASSEGTRFDDTHIRQAQAVLLTFGNVQGEVFEKVLRHAQNFAELFGTDLTTAVRMFGRAFQESGSEGLRVFSRYLGDLDPQMLKHIDQLVAQGRLADANAEKLKLFDDKFKDLAVTIGTSAPASFDQMRKAWNQLFEELGRTAKEEGVFSFIEQRLRNITGWVKEWPTISRGLRLDRLMAQLERDPSSEVIKKQIADIREEIRKEDEQRAQAEINEIKAREQAMIAAAKKAEEERLRAQKEMNEKLEKQRLEALEKRERAEMEALRKRLDLEDIDVAKGEKTLSDKLRMIDVEIQAVKQNSAAHILLMQQRQQVLDKTEGAEHKALQNRLKIYDIDIARNQSTLDKKLQFINAELYYTEQGTDKWIFLMEERGRTLDALRRKIEENDRELKKIQDAQSRRLEKQADEEIGRIRRTFFTTQEQRIAALDELAHKYFAMGEKGKEAYEKVQKAIRDTETTAERDMKRWEEFLDSFRLDTLTSFMNVFKGIQNGWQSTFVAMLKGQATFREGMRGLWKSIADAVINEIARMLAAWLAMQAAMGAASIFGGTLLGGFFAGLAGGGGGTAAAAALALQSGGDVVVTKPTTFLVGEGGVAQRPAWGGGFQTGGRGIFTRPTFFRAGEGGPELVSVRPLAGASRLGGSAGPTVIFNGLNVMDAFTRRRFVRDVERAVRREAMRHG